MATTITSDLATVTPELVTGYETRQSARNVIHEIVGRGDPDVTLRPARSRSGRLRCLFLDAADADGARYDLAQADVWALADTDLPEIDMSFVLTGETAVRLDPDTLLRWVVEFDYREVLP
jgi:hypothetical protein